MDRPIDAPQFDKPIMSISTVMFLVFLLTAGITLLGVTIFYVHDMETLASLPGIVWNFICGVPNEGGITLPALALSTLMSFAAAAIIYGRWRWQNRSS